MVNMKANAVHSWTSLRKCLNEINRSLAALAPLGRKSQLTNPVRPNIENRIKEVTLMNHNFAAFVLRMEAAP
mgnify:FL=1